MISRQKRKKMQDERLAKAAEQQKKADELVQKTEDIRLDFLGVYEDILMRRGRAN